MKKFLNVLLMVVVVAAIPVSAMNHADQEDDPRLVPLMMKQIKENWKTGVMHGAAICMISVIPAVTHYFLAKYHYYCLYSLTAHLCAENINCAQVAVEYCAGTELPVAVTELCKDSLPRMIGGYCLPF